MSVWLSLGRRALRHGLAVVALAALGWIAHRPAMTAGIPLNDEAVFLGAAREVAAGRSPYDHPVYNYPPPLAQLGAWAISEWGERKFLTLLRLANLLAGVALAWLAARHLDERVVPRGLLAGAALALSPLFRQAYEFGNLTPLVACAALSGWAISDRRPAWAAMVVGASLALKPVALVGAVFITVQGFMTRRPGESFPWGRIAWPLPALLLLAPGASFLPEVFGRMVEPPIQVYHLTLRRVLAGLGWTLPAWLIAAAVLGTALVAFRRERLREGDLELAGPVVALLALPVVWGYTMLLTLPLQAAALAGLRARWRSAARRRWLEAGGIVAAFLALQGAGAVGVLEGWPSWLHAAVVALPTLAPLGLLVYLRRTADS